MKKIIYVAALSILSLQSNAQSAKFAWNTTIGGGGNEEAKAVTTDAMGHIFTVGKFTGTVDFDPGPGVFFLSSNGLEDAYISKQDPSGAFLWAKSFGGATKDEAISVTLDAFENIYITGNFSGGVNFNNGILNGEAGSMGGIDIFTVKLDPSGFFQWVRTNGDRGHDEIRSNTWDKLGYVYNTGTAWTGVEKIENVFISKIDPGGFTVWGAFFGTNAMDIGNDISTDRFGNVYTIGTFEGAGDFDPTIGETKLITNGMKDIFLTKHNSLGHFVWAKQIGGPNEDIGKSIHITDSSQIYITGTFSGKVDFDLSTLDSDTQFIISKGMKDMFLAKLDLNGKLVWVKNIGATDAECFGVDVKTDNFGNIIVSGAYSDTIDFDPNPSKIYELGSAGNQDIFIAKFDSSGNFIWAKQIGGLQDDNCTSTAVDITGNIITTGLFRDTVDFNPAKEEYKMSSNGNSDAYVHKMAYCIPVHTTIKDTLCKPFTLDGVTYDKTGVYNQTITGIAGCEEFVTLDIDIRIFNDTISKSGAVLTSHANGVKYQWIECTSKKEIPGATGKSYIALGNNKYAVTLFDGSCRDTSDCMEINSFTASMEEFALQNSIQVFPNPSNGEFVIAVNDNMLGAKAGIYNLLGQKVREVELNEINTKQSLTPGFYILEISKDQKRFTKKLLVE